MILRTTIPYTFRSISIRRQAHSLGPYLLSLLEPTFCGIGLKSLIQGCLFDMVLTAKYEALGLC